jgi:hypothetical protein
MRCKLGPQPKNPQPLNANEVRKMVGPEATTAEFDQVRKLFICVHGVTLNWRQARLRLGLPVRTAPIGEEI